MARPKQPKKIPSRKSPRSKTEVAKPSVTNTEENQPDDPVLQTLKSLHSSLVAGRQILDDADAILVYYVAVVNRDSVISVVKGTNHLAELLKDARRNEAATTIDTMLTVAIRQPMIGKIQSHMEEAADTREDPPFATERDLKQVLRGGLDKLLSAPQDVEMAVNGDEGLEEDEDE